MPQIDTSHTLFILDSILFISFAPRIHKQQIIYAKMYDDDDDAQHLYGTIHPFSSPDTLQRSFLNAPSLFLDTP